MASSNGKSWLWRGAIGIIVGLLSFLSTFMFNRVVAIPETYVTIEQNKDMHIEDRTEQTQLETRTERALDRIYKQMDEIHSILIEKL